MSKPSFIHLRLHSEYSITDGIGRLDEGGLMTSPFLTGDWRADASDTSLEGALQDLYTNYLGADNHLEWVEGADLPALMGGFDPLSLPRPEAAVVEAALVSGWGFDGRDEAIVLLSRLPDGSHKWHGWIVIKGGFSGAPLGGLQPYTNLANGYSFFVPTSYEIVETDPTNVMILAPGEGHPGEGRAAAFIYVKPAGGQTVEQIVEQFKADIGPGFEILPGTALGLEYLPRLGEDGRPEHMAGIIRRLEPCTIADASHMLHHERPAELARAIEAFLGRT